MKSIFIHFIVFISLYFSLKWEVRKQSPLPIPFDFDISTVQEAT